MVFTSEKRETGPGGMVLVKEVLDCICNVLIFSRIKNLYIICM